MFGLITQLLPLFFGSSKNGRGIVDVVERFIPSAASIEEGEQKDKAANAESQASARAMKFRSHESWLDIIIDAWNRAMRPMITTGLVGIWFGWWAAPDLTDLNPFYIQMTMIVFTFWFGGRFVTKDIMPAVQTWRERKKKKEDSLLSDYETEDDYEN